MPDMITTREDWLIELRSPTGARRAFAERDGGEWVVCEGKEGISIGVIRDDLPPPVRTACIEAMLRAVAETPWRTDA